MAAEDIRQDQGRHRRDRDRREDQHREAAADDAEGGRTDRQSRRQRDRKVLGPHVHRKSEREGPARSDIVERLRPRWRAGRFRAPAIGRRAPDPPHYEKHADSDLDHVRPGRHPFCRRRRNEARPEREQRHEHEHAARPPREVADARRDGVRREQKQHDREDREHAQRRRNPQRHDVPQHRIHPSTLGPRVGCSRCQGTMSTGALRFMSTSCTTVEMFGGSSLWPRPITSIAASMDAVSSAGATLSATTRELRSR